jgi:hypothetical protein
VCDRPKYVFPMVAHILGIYEFKCLGDLGVRGFFVLQEVVGEFLVYLGIGWPFVYIWEFMFG